METVTQAASAAYYLGHMASHRSPFHYYNAGDEPDGRWWNPSGLFGLDDGEVIGAEQFQALYAGLSPDDLSPLARNSNRKGRSPGIDITFSADKSVSALWAIAPPGLRRQIEACHHDAVRWTLENVTRAHCAYTRRGRGGAEVVSGDIFGTTFQHHTSRDGDPQLHTHCVLFNLVRTHEDGRWRTLHQRPIYQWVRAGGAIYRHAIAWYLQERIGLEVERYGREDEYVRIAGLPEELLRAWSSRRDSIERLASKLGISTAETPTLSQQISLSTRTRKEPGDPDERDARFLEEASQYVERDTLIAELLSHSVTPPTLDQIRAVQRRCNEIPARLTRAEAVFSVPQILEHVARESACAVSPEALKTMLTRVLRHSTVLALDGHRAGSSADARANLAHTRLYSTLDYAAEEQAVQSAAQRSLGASGYALPTETINRRLETLSAAGFPIGEQQRSAVHHLAGGDTPLSVCLGAAGSGKTLALRPVADLYRQHGKRVIATALAWNAAVNLATECGAHPYSLARFFTQVAAGTIAIDRDTVLLVDEAGMLSVREIRTVLDIAERSGAKVHFIGDLDQLQPIEAGPGLRLLVDELGAAQIETIRRQRPDLEDLLTWRRGIDAATAARHAPLLSEAERAELLAERAAFPGQGWQARASEAARRGDAGAVIDAYSTRGRLHLESNFERAISRIAEDWLRHRRDHPEESRLVIARTNREVRALSRVLRASAHPHDPERPSVTVSTSTGEPGKRQTVPLEIAVGDTIRVRTTLFPQQLFNGSLLSVDAVAIVRDEGQERVRITATTQDRRQVTFHADEARDIHGNIRLEYGYAATIASAQGLTTDRVFLLADDRPPRETIYPALTRHRDRLDIYLDTAPLALAVRQYRSEEDWDKPVTRAELHDHLAHRWSRSGAKEAAHDYASPERRADIASRIAEEAARRSSRELMRTLRPAASEPVAEELSTELADRVLARLSTRGGAFSRDDVRRILWSEALPRPELDRATEHVLSHPHVMPLFGYDATDEQPKYATTQTYAAEEQVTRLAARLHADLSHPAFPSERMRERHLRSLAPDAAAAARAMLAGGRLNVVSLPADGTREAALSAAARALARAGTNVIACGPSRNALRPYDGAVERPRSVYGLIRDLSDGRLELSRTSLVLVNEADALDTDSLHTLARLTHEARVRLVLVGDSRDQCRSPAFSWLARHCASAALPPRAPDQVPEIARTALSGDLDTHALLERLDSSRQLHAVDTRQALKRSVLRAWTECERDHPQHTQLVFVSSAADAHELNQVLQSTRQRAGHLGRSVTFDVLRPSFSDSHGPSADAALLARSPGTTDRLTVHVGDRLRILENDPRSGLCRGDVGTVLSVSKRRIRLDVNGRLHTFDPRRHNRFTLGYAASIFQRTAPVDHVHAAVSTAWTRPLLYRATSAHRSTLTAHWCPLPGQNTQDLAHAIDARRGPPCTQFYLDRQRALQAAQSDSAAPSRLRSAWHLLSDTDRDRLQRQDREHRVAIHAHQRPRDRKHTWLERTRPATLAGAVRLVAQYRVEGNAALAYQHEHDTLNHELEQLRARATTDQRSALDDAAYPRIVQRLEDLAQHAQARAERSEAFRLALSAKTRFTPEDLPRHQVAFAHERRAVLLHEEARRTAEHVHTKLLAFCLQAEDRLEEGAELSTLARNTDTRPWFLDEYATWHSSLHSLESDREALAGHRADIDTRDSAAAHLLARFDDVSEQLARVDDYHQRETRAAELVSRYQESHRTFNAFLSEYYAYEPDRSPERHRELQAGYDTRFQAIHTHAEQIVGATKWHLPHLERAGLSLQEVTPYAEDITPSIAIAAQQRAQSSDKDISF